MTLSQLSESSDKQILVIYPGRFQPFHRGHKAVFDYLNNNYNNVYIATSDKVALPKSPFSFNEKKKMMELTGMDTSKVVLTKSPYVATEITQHFDKENTIVFFAVSEKDMASDPRFGFKPKKDGSPSYFQPKPNDDSSLATMDKHGYIMTVPTFNFDVLGAPMKSATEVRAAFSSMDDKTKKKLIQDLFGNYSDEVFNLMSTKITESAPSSFSLSSQYGYDHDHRRIFGGADQALIIATDELKALMKKLQNLPPGTKVRARFLSAFHTMIASVKQQMANSIEVREGIALLFNNRELKRSELNEYYISRFANSKNQIFQSRLRNDVVRYNKYHSIMESMGELTDIETWLSGVKSSETAKKIKIGDQIAVIDLDINFGWSEIILGGFIDPKEITNISTYKGKISVIRFADGSTYPKDAKEAPAYKNRPLQLSYFYNDADECEEALSYVRIALPNEWNLIDEMDEPENISEGGWTDTVTQKTKLTPQVVRSALKIVERFTTEFNDYLNNLGHPPVTMGSPTGSSAYHDVDDSDKEYGDIDLQMIGPDQEGRSPNQLAAFYNKLVDSFVTDHKPSYVYDQGKPAGGHVIFKIGSDHVQVDLMWSGKTLSDWSRWRVTPQRGIKGLITGNMYSAFGDVIGMSIQTAGVQMKTIGGEPAPFNKRKGAELITITTDIKNFGMDILKAVFQHDGAHGDLQIDSELKQYPGLKTDDVKITDLAHTIKGLAKSFELNDMYGSYVLKDYSSAQDLINAFLARFEAKAVEASNAPKFKKATGDAELQKVKNIQGQIQKGLSLVKKTFMENTMNTRNLGIYKKGNEVVGLWESKGNLLLVDHKTKAIKETRMANPNAVKRLLDKKGWVIKESFQTDMITLINSAGYILKVFSDKVKGTTTVRDKTGGSKEYQASLAKVLGSLQQKGYKRHDGAADDTGGLSLEPQDDRPFSQQNGSNGSGHFMNLQASVDSDDGNLLMDDDDHEWPPECGNCSGTGVERGNRTCDECDGSGFEKRTIRDESCPDCNGPDSDVSIGGVSYSCSTCGGDGIVRQIYDKYGDYVGQLTEGGEQELMANAQYPKYGYEKKKAKMKRMTGRQTSSTMNLLASAGNDTADARYRALIEPWLSAVSDDGVDPFDLAMDILIDNPWIKQYFQEKERTKLSAREIRQYVAIDLA